MPTAPSSPELSPDNGPADRFIRRTRSIATLLAHGLAGTLSHHDLTPQRLWAAHRNVAELKRQGRAPTPSEFWEQTANPEAQDLLGEAVHTIDAEKAEFTRALQQFTIAVGERHRWQAMGSPSAASEADALQANLEVANAAVIAFINAAATGDQINEVGAWWQGKLRRRAILATCGRLLFTPLGRYELEVTSAEMRLLDEAPWSHDDRMLSAFELAHNDLRDHVAQVEIELARQARAMLGAVHNTSIEGGAFRATTTGHPHPRAARTDSAETIELA